MFGSSKYLPFLCGMENTISYSFDELEIVGAQGKEIYVRSMVYSEEQEKLVCLQFSMNKWIELQKSWISEKKAFCERYEHFCGWGDVTSHYKNNGYSIELLDPETNEMKRVSILIPTDFLVDMEHG
jgi:hypothetical protein